MRLSNFALGVVVSLAAFVYAHTVITYPGWRGDNLGMSGTIESTNGLGADYENGSLVYPYGEQWIYPCE